MAQDGGEAQRPKVCPLQLPSSRRSRLRKRDGELDEGRPPRHQDGFLQDMDQWDEARIMKRGRELFKIVQGVWPHPGGNEAPEGRNE